MNRSQGALFCGVVGLMMLVSPALASSFLDEWRFPDEADITGDWKYFQEKGREHYMSSADFDGDGKRDEAWILIKKDNREWGLFVFLNADSSEPKIIELGRTEMAIDPPQRMGVGTVPPGHYESACAKGYGSECAPGERRFVDLQNPAIDFYLFESANSYFFWNEDTDGFERIWISD